ncbi:43 kDa receptor-associated protein of the synapse-like [Saccoglossus kowalevskii]|uniref:43 kDa receptor-associated protein of the synapse-like n=1 Tax=Saccoglossus kowalevskii TaxID=10224 RepID=A0ABM0M2T8_SACKO|nr:PREDICTED: 43 kDa receptor-associated protein of the synapse-like [Saccoglossus kowalevskii]
MGQKWVRKLVDDGLRLYRDQEPYEAVVKWKRAVAKATDGRDKFVALGYLAWAHCEWGKYRDMLHYSVQQIDVANETNSNEMRAEAYLNLARSNEKLCEYHKAISYCRHSLSQATKNPKTLGQVYLCLGNAYLGFSDFQKALENMHNALHLALKNEDRSLECNTYGSLGDFYILLRDYERALQYHLKGAEMVAKCGEDWSVKFHTLARLNLANPYRKLQRLNIALECTEDAMKLALQHCDRNTQSRCLCLFADILIDWAMNKTTSDRRRGITWSMFSVLEDLDFTDDIALLSSKQGQVQEKTRRLSYYAKQIGLQINTKKTQEMRLNSTCNSRLVIDGAEIEQVDQFTYLGAVVSNENPTPKDIEGRLAKARSAWLWPIWKSSQYNISTKVKIYNSNVKSILLHRSESWRVTKVDMKKLSSFHHNCLRRICKMF